MGPMELISMVGAALSGGLGVKVVERLMPSRDKELDDDAKMRSELWTRVERLEAHVERFQEDRVRLSVEVAQLQARGLRCDECPRPWSPVATVPVHVVPTPSGTVALTLTPS